MLVMNSIVRMAFKRPSSIGKGYRYLPKYLAGRPASRSTLTYPPDKNALLLDTRCPISVPVTR